MSDKKIESTDLAKAMAALQDLAKGHGSTGTATTAVPGMTGVSGPTQLFHTAANSDPGGWAGSSWRGEGWEDSISANGTDLTSAKAMAKAIASSIMAKLSKSEPLSAREVDFVSKGGLNFLKDKGDDKDEKKDVAKSHDDAAEDKKQIKDMVKPAALEKSDVNKSLLDNVQENAATKPGFEVSEFLSGFVQVMHKSLQSMEARITDRVVTAVAKSAADDAESQNNLAKSLSTLGEVLTLHAQRIEQIEAGPARGAKSQQISKSGPAPLEGGAGGGEVLSKAIVSERLLDLVKKSEATAQDVLRYDATGELSDALKRKVASR